MHKRQSGLTMMELLIVLSIVGVMTTMLVPPMSDFVDAGQVNNDAAMIYGSLMLARSESVTRNSIVSLCKIEPESPTVCNNNKGWQSGWIAFEDTDFDGVRDAGEEIFHTSTGMSRKTTVTATNFTNSISFYPSGAVSTNGSLNICVGGQFAVAIFINATGRPRTIESECT